MRRLLLLLPILVIALSGCKGKLPTMLTAAKRNTSQNVTSITPLVLGKPAHEFSGELVFGREPMEGVQKDDLVIVTWQTSLDKVPEFFFHNHLYPKVRYLQYVSELDDVPVLSQIRAHQAKGDVVEGLSVLKVIYKTHQYLGHMQYDWPFKIIQNGKLVAVAFSEDLDETVSKVIAGKFDTAKQASDFVQQNLALRLADRTWSRMIQPYDEGTISFESLSANILAALKSMKSETMKGHIASDYLYIAGCRRWPEVSKVITEIAKTESVAYAAQNDLERHLQHPECRERVLNDFDLALKDKVFRSHSGSCRYLAIAAIALDKKDVAKQLLRDMMLARNLKPRYASETREFFRQEYDDLMYRASH